MYYSKQHTLYQNYIKLHIIVQLQDTHNNQQRKHILCILLLFKSFSMNIVRHMQVMLMEHAHTQNWTQTESVHCRSQYILSPSSCCEIIIENIISNGLAMNIIYGNIVWTHISSLYWLLNSLYWLRNIIDIITCISTAWGWYKGQLSDVRSCITHLISIVASSPVFLLLQTVSLFRHTMRARVTITNKTTIKTSDTTTNAARKPTVKLFSNTEWFPSSIIVRKT